MIPSYYNDSSPDSDQYASFSQQTELDTLASACFDQLENIFSLRLPEHEDLPKRYQSSRIRESNILADPNAGLSYHLDDSGLYVTKPYVKPDFYYINRNEANTSGYGNASSIASVRASHLHHPQYQQDFKKNAFGVLTMHCMTHGGRVEVRSCAEDHFVPVAQFYKQQIELVDNLNAIMLSDLDLFNQFSESFPDFDLYFKVKDNRLYGTLLFYRDALNDLGNLWLICQACNNEKSDKNPYEFLRANWAFGEEFHNYLRDQGKLNEEDVLFPRYNNKAGLADLARDFFYAYRKVYLEYDDRITDIVTPLQQKNKRLAENFSPSSSPKRSTSRSQRKQRDLDYEIRLHELIRTSRLGRTSLNKEEHHDSDDDDFSLLSLSDSEYEYADEDIRQAQEDFFTFVANRAKALPMHVKTLAKLRNAREKSGDNAAEIAELSRQKDQMLNEFRMQVMAGFSTEQQADILRKHIASLQSLLDSKLSEQNAAKEDVSQHSPEQGGTRFRLVARKNEQLGWNCFDVAVGFDRKQLVRYALSKKSDPAFRRLLAPEIRQAMAISAINYEAESCASDTIVETHDVITRLATLFDISDALEGGNDCQDISEMVGQLIDRIENSTQDLSIDPIIRGGLPKKMWTKEAKDLIDEYFGADFEITELCNQCNDLLGIDIGNRLSFEALQAYFNENPPESDEEQEAFNLLDHVSKEIIGSKELALTDFCESEATYEAYIKHYYGAEEWVAFQRSLEGESAQNTSIVDIVACMMKKMIVIYQPSKQGGLQEIYRTDEQGSGNTIYVLYNGTNHFQQLQIVPENRPVTRSISRAAAQTQSFFCPGDTVRDMDTTMHPARTRERQGENMNISSSPSGQSSFGGYA